MSNKCRAYSESKLGLEPPDNRKAFYAGWDAALKAALAEPVQEPVAWKGYDLDAMAEAFGRVIEAYHSNNHPFHNPIDSDARMALRILRGFIPAMKAYTAPPQRQPLTEDEIHAIARKHDITDDDAPDWLVQVIRAIERAHGITGETK